MNVSIIMPTLHRLEYLTHAVAQIQTQTFQDWELIVVEEAPWGNRVWDDPRVRVHQVMWHGASKSRNYGLELATGDLVWFADDDNYYDPWLLEKMVAEFRKDPNLILAGVPYQRIFMGYHAAPAFVAKREHARKWSGNNYWSAFPSLDTTSYIGGSPLFYVTPAPTGGLRDPEGRS